MGITPITVYEQLKRYQKQLRNLKSKYDFELENNEKIYDYAEPYPSFGNKIEGLGKSLEELCKTVFGGSDKDNDPFYGMVYGVNTNDPPRNIRMDRLERDKSRLDLLENFIKRKIDKVGIYIDSELAEIPNKDDQQQNSTSITPPQMNIENIQQYVAGNVNSITNITNILQQLKKEIENESNLTPTEKLELQKEVEETSGKLDNVKNSFAKYGGKFTGHVLRSFIGLPED